MKANDLKAEYGDEYPAAVVFEGVRMPLERETCFTRFYDSEDQKRGFMISRFMDGSASVTAKKLQQEWSAWTEDERIEFCYACAWLYEQSDFPEMLRFIMQHGGPYEWCGIALPVSTHLPQEEAFDLLRQALRITDIGRTSNLTQGIAHTKHPGAEALLRQHLRSVWSHQSLWDDDEFTNWVAFDATTCIEHLLELGAPAADFEDQVRRLSQHICSGNRESCNGYLTKHYSWLKQNNGSAPTIEG